MGRKLTKVFDEEAQALKRMSVYKGNANFISMLDHHASGPSKNEVTLMATIK